MAGAALVIDIRGLAALREVGDRLAAFGEVSSARILDVVGAVVESQTRRRLADEKKSPEGEPWQPLTAAYEARKRKGDQDHKPSSGGLLEREGLLIDSITQEVSGDTLRVGSNQPYAAVHQFGFEPRGIPARPYLGLGAGDVGEIAAALEDFFADLAARHLSGTVTA